MVNYFRGINYRIFDVRIIIISILLLFFQTHTVFAADKINDMRSKCKSAIYVNSIKDRLNTFNKTQLENVNEEIRNGIMCVSYLSGIIEMMFNACGELSNWKRMLKDKGISDEGIKFYTIPYKINSIRATGISSEQMAQIYLNATDEFPNYWDTYQGARIFKNHLMKLYPCES